MAGRTKAKSTAVMEEVTSEAINPIAEAGESSEEAAIEPLHPEAEEKASFFIYLGPTIQNVIQNASIYTGTRAEVEKRLESQIRKFPRIRVLLISGDTVVEDRANVNKPGTRLYTEYHRLVYELKK